MGIGGNWGEEEEMGDKFLGKDEKENSKEDRIEKKEKGKKRPKRREKTKKDDRSSGRQEATDEKENAKKEMTRNYRIFALASSKFTRPSSEVWPIAVGTY